MQAHREGNPQPTPNQRTKPATRKGWRQLIWPDYANAENGRRAYDPRFIKKFGAEGGLMLGQLVYWSDKTDDPDGWIWKVQKEWNEEIGLTRNEARRGRRRLVEAGVIEEKIRKGIPPRNHYRVDFLSLAKALQIPIGLTGGSSISQQVAQPSTHRQPEDEPEGASTMVHLPAHHSETTQGLRQRPHHLPCGGRTQRAAMVPVMETHRDIGEGGALEEKKLEKCVDTIRSIGGATPNRDALRELVAEQARRYPRLDLADVCRKYRDHATEKMSKGDPVRNHRAYLPGFFERADDARASEPCSAHSPEGKRQGPDQMPTAGTRRVMT